MALQTQNLAMVGIGISQDRPPNTIQPPLIDGVHLRWSVPLAQGFPWYGFYLFRRPHLAGTPTLLSSALGNLHPGPLPTSTLNTPYGQMSSDQPLMLTDTFPPTGQVEFDLDNRSYTHFTFSPDQTARSIQATIGLRSRAGDPPATRTVVDFSNRTPGAGPNPVVEQGITFEVFDPQGQQSPVSHILPVPGTAPQTTGLDCKWSLAIILPTSATYIQATLTPLLISATVQAFNADGTNAGIATTQKPYGRMPETLTITGQAITRIVIQPNGEVSDSGGHPGQSTSVQNPLDDPSSAHTLLNQFCFGTGRLVVIPVTAFSSDTPVAHSRVYGQTGQVISSSLEFEGITAVEFGSDSAALIDLGFVPLTQDATTGWTTIPDFTYPLRLPVTQPTYPCTPNATENLAAARTLAQQRIFYGDPKLLTAPPTPITSTGTITVTNNSQFVTGSGTNWSTTLANAMLQVKGDPTAYMVVQVISPTKLVLSRHYASSSATGVAYALNQDVFGQYYDHLLQLVSGGSAAGPMANRTLPAPVYTAGTASVSQNSQAVNGSGTTWDASLVGLAFQIGNDPTAYTIIGVNSPTLLTLDHGYQENSQSGQPYQIIANINGQQTTTASGSPPRLSQQRVLDIVMLSTLQPAIAQMTGLYWVDRKAVPGTAYDYLVVADYNGVGQLDPAKILARLQQDGFASLEGSIIFNKQLAPSFPLAEPDDLRIYALPGSSRLAADGTLQDASNTAGLRWNLGATDPGVLLPGHAIFYHLWRASLGTGPTPTIAGSYTLLTQNQPVLVTIPQLPAGAVPRRALDWPPFPLHFIDSGLSDGWYGYQVSGIDIFGRYSRNSTSGAWYEWTPPPEPQPWYYTDPPGDNIIHPSAVRLLSKRVPPPPTGIEAYALDPADPALLQDAAYTAWFATLSASEQQSVIGLRVRWSWTQAQMQQAPDTQEFRVYYHPGRMNTLAGQTSGVAFVSGTNGAECYVQTNIAHTQTADAYAGAWLRAGADSFAIIGSDASTPLRLRVRTIGPSTATGTITVTNGSLVITGVNTNWGIELTGLTLQVAGDPATYTVASVDSTTRLTLDQPYSGPTGTGQAYTAFDIIPLANTPCTIAIPPAYGTGTVTLAAGSPTVKGTGCNWSTGLLGMPFQVAGEQTVYAIASVDTQTQLTLDRPYVLPASDAITSDRLYAIRFPLYVDYGASTNWEERYYVVGFNEHVTITTDDQGQPLRSYEVLLPAAGDTYRAGVSLPTSLTAPIAYAWIGVSAADNRTSTLDAPKWASGRWGNRPGNEGRVGPPASIFRVRRDPVPVPALPTPSDPEHSTASQADDQNRSFYTYRWLPADNLQAHIYRGLDETLFQVDWAARPGPALDATQAQFFPNPATEPRWIQALCQQVASSLNQLNTFTHDAAGTDQARAYYRGLSNDALRILAGLPGNEAAFSQLTAVPLDPANPANSDRSGPDTPPAHTPNPNLRAYIDTLNGLADNRYLYRLLYVDAAHNRSGLSLASVPVLVPDVVAPRTPVITKILGGDRQITLRWASNREPDLKEYRVYRTDNAASTGNLGQMTLVHTETVPSGNPASRPAEVVWTDAPVQGRIMLYYLLIAADNTGNVSSATLALPGQAFDDSHPDPPTWNLPVPSSSSGTLVLSWTSPITNLACLVQRSPAGAGAWSNISRWLPRGTYTFTDTGRAPNNTYDYRLLVLSSSGRQNVSFNILTS